MKISQKNNFTLPKSQDEYFIYKSFNNWNVLEVTLVVAAYENSIESISAPTPQNVQTHSIRRQQPTTCLSVFDHFVGLALKGLRWRFLLSSMNYFRKKVSS